ncbi:PhoH family protein [Thiothrix nivea]|uniref:PhoH family protein n=1 Tax=Thiothrix nivea (strain ATCC 35100 / DSM 5205 / JP2) TaxID=870187 RepID=A0A656HJH0_THINJ|nr:PhoH family protein [Thiothrix nivea]EIJ35389.1 PhoH family protein [Thiothrix nivea DSM 5205]
MSPVHAPHTHEKRLFVLDTNVLMHDPTALFRFQEHDIFLPMVVLEELDRGKKGVSEVARNVRQVSRFLDDLISAAGEDSIRAGVEIATDFLRLNNGKGPTGKLLFQTETLNGQLPTNLPGDSPDNSILSVALSLQSKFPERDVILVSKDINLRIKATIVGLKAEDYFNDQVLDDADLLPTGFHELPADFWDGHSKEMKSWQEQGHTFYKLVGPMTDDWLPGHFLAMPGDSPFEAIVREKSPDHAVIETIRDFTETRHAVWGITARNREQNFALNLLMDPEIDIVTLLGAAGTGKTLLTLAAGLAQLLDEQLYKEIIMTRVTVPVGEDIGFLPGTEEEKMTPWMGALMDNLEVLTQPANGGKWGRTATDEFLMSKIKVKSLNFMRGRTFLNRYIIIDEAQNLTPKQMKTLITRAGPGTKVVCLGNIAQIDTPYLTETSSGLTYVVDRFKGWPHGGHVTLQRGERSRLADYASDHL